MHHMLNPDRDEPNLLQILRKNGYFVWWGGKNDLVPGQLGYEDHCDEMFRPTKEDYLRWKVEPHPGNHGGDLSWRGKPDGDNFCSFFKGRLDSKPGKAWFDHDWAMVYGAIDFVQRYSGSKPFCLFLPIGYPHPPYCVEEPWYSITDREMVPPRHVYENWKDKPSLLRGIRDGQNLTNWSEERWTELRATYYGMCSRVDHQLGLVLGTLRESERYDNTAVFFFSDHGDFTGDYGLVEKTQNTFQDCLSRVPLVVKPPKSQHMKPGIRNALVELIDFPATVYALAGIDSGYWHFGKSLVDQFSNDNLEHRDAVFTEGGRLPQEIQASEVESVASNGSLGLYSPRVNLQVAETLPLPHTKAAACRTHRFKYTRRAGEQDEFYDLENDVGETRNLIDDPNYSSEILRHKERMLTWYMETADVVPRDTDKRWFA